MKLTGIALLLCQVNGDTVGYCPQNQPSQLGEDSGKFESKCGCDQLVDVSSDGLGVRSVAVSIVSFQAQLVWGLHACGRCTVTFPTWRRCQYLRSWDAVCAP